MRIYCAVVSNLIAIATYVTVSLAALTTNALSQDFPPSEVLAESREEIIDQRTIASKTFQNEDGSTTWQLGSGPIHFQNPGNAQEWLDIDTALTENNGWENNTNNIAIHLPLVLGDGAPITLGGERQLNWQPGPLLAVLFSGEEMLIAEPQPSESEMVEGSNNAVIYRNLYPGGDLLVEVNNGQISISLDLTTLEFDGDRSEVSSIQMETHLESDPQLNEAMELHLGQTKIGYSAPLFFGTSEDEYVIALTGNRAEDSIIRELKEDGINTARRKTEKFLSDGTVRQVFEVPGARGDSSSSTAALTAKFTIVGLKKMTALQSYSPARAVTIVKGEKNRFNGLPIAVREKAPPPPPKPKPFRWPWDNLPGPLPPTPVCLLDDHCAPGLVCDKTFSSCLWNGHTPGEKPFNLLHEEAKALVTFSGLGKLKSRLNNANTRINAVSLGYKINKKDNNSWISLARTTNQRIADMSFLMATRIETSLLSPQQSIADLPSKDKTVLDAISNSFSYNINCTIHAGFACRGTNNSLISSWASHNRIWKKNGFTFGRLDGLARSDLENVINSGGDNFHMGFMASLFDTSIAVSDFRLEFTAHGAPSSQDFSNAELVYTTLNSSGVPDKNAPNEIRIGEKLKLQLDLVKLNTASSINVKIANAVELWRDYGLELRFVDAVNQSIALPDPVKLGVTSPLKSRAILEINWGFVPGRDIDNLPKTLPVIELEMAFPNQPASAKKINIALDRKLPQVELVLSNGGKGSVTVVPTDQFTFFDNYRIKPKTLRGASTILLFADSLQTPSGTLIKDPDVLNKSYATITKRALQGSDQATFAAFPDQIVRNLNSSGNFKPGNYQFTVKACFDSLLYNSWCPAKMKYRYSLAIQPAGVAPPTIDFVAIEDGREPACIAQPNCKKPINITIFGDNLLKAQFGGNTKTANVSLSHLTDQSSPLLPDVTPFVMQAGASDQKIEYKGEIGGLAICGPYEVRYVLALPNVPFQTNYSRILNLHRGKKEMIVMEAEGAKLTSPFATFVDAPVYQSSHKAVLGSNGTTGDMQLMFRVGKSGKYKIYMTERNQSKFKGAIGGNLDLVNVDNLNWSGKKSNVKWTVPNQTKRYNITLVNLPGTDEVDLDANQTYRLTLRPNKSGNVGFPLIDSIIISEGSRPTDKELCR